MIENYFKHEALRQEKGIPALPLNPELTAEICQLLEKEGEKQAEILLSLLKDRVSPGVDPSAKVKAEFLSQLVKAEKKSPYIDRLLAVEMLSTMVGGYNIEALIYGLEDEEIAEACTKALSHITLVYDQFDTVVKLSANNSYAQRVLKSWAEAEWFTSREALPERIELKAYKVDGEINTDDFSPASDAATRPDIPLHALSMGKSLFPDGIETITKWREEGHKVAFVGDVVGTGSSRKSASNSVLWHIGEDIDGIPNKRNQGFVLGGVIAPIFFNTVEDSGGLPVVCDVTKIQSGDLITLDTKAGVVYDKDNKALCEFNLSPNTITDEYRAGGRINLIIGKSLTEKARQALGLEPSTIFKEAQQPVHKENQGYTLAQKLVGKAIGAKGVLPGQACTPFMTTVGSQDTTGPMTADELKELACLKFQSPLFMQSFCHTAAYPKPTDVKMQASLPEFISQRHGVALEPGDGVIHTWLNRLLVPDTVGTGGDSHTRFPLGISFPAGSGLVAFAGALGFMPLDMPESVLVKFKGELQDGITLRDVVGAIPLEAIKQGKLTVPKKNKINIFNGRILEMEGLPNITVEQAFELTDATAERSAAAATIKLSEETVCTYVRSNIALMEQMIKDGYQHAPTLQNRIDELKAWLKNPQLLSRDENAEYAEVIEIDLSEIKEPILACPNDPDDVKTLSEVAGQKINDVFIGSCMTNIGHFRAAAKVWDGKGVNKEVNTFMAPPTKMDAAQLRKEGLYSTFGSIGASMEVPGCSLCMGNQLRVADADVVFSTSTRNFDNRMGKGAQVYLGSGELGSIISVIGKIPSTEEYFEYYNKYIKDNKEEIYKYLQFDEK